jgi:hypothetical protein
MAKKLQEQQAVRPGVLIVVAAVAAVAVGFFIVNMLMSHSGGKTPSAPAPSAPAGAAANNGVDVTTITIPTLPPPPPSSGRDPFQQPAGLVPATPAPAAAATPGPIETAKPAATVKPEFQQSASPAFVQVLSSAADHKSAVIRDGTIIYEQARPGQTLDRGVVVDAINASGCVALHRGGAHALLCPGNRVLM